MNGLGRRGFTLVELLMVLVLGTILVLATFQTLASNTRVYAVNSSRAMGQQSLRAGAAILSGELREISPGEGDLLQIEDDAVQVRAQRSFGLVCNVDYSSNPAKVTSFRVGPTFEAGDSVFIFHDNDPERHTDDEWLGGVVTAVEETVACGGNLAQVLTVPFVSASALAANPDSVRLGAPVRGFEVFTLGLYEIEGEPYLGRLERNGADPDPLVGPLLPSDGVSFRYLDDRGQETNVETNVTQIEVMLRYQSEMRNFQSELVSDSLLIRIFPRN